MKSVQDSIARFKRGVQGGKANYQAGVEAVREAPGLAAARAVNKYQAGVAKAVEDGAYVDGCQSVSLGEWQTRTAKVGADRFAASAADAEVGYGQYLTAVAPQLASIQSKIQSMPSETPEDMEARALENIRSMRQLRYKRKK